MNMQTTQAGRQVPRAAHRFTIAPWCLGGMFAAASLILLPLAARAQTAPLAHMANPGVYQVLQENEQFRVLLATWKPGQRDDAHSHPPSTTYAVTPCVARLYGADNKVMGEGPRAAGTVTLQAAIPAHSLENIGTSDCQVLIVERK